MPPLAFATAVVDELAPRAPHGGTALTAGVARNVDAEAEAEGFLFLVLVLMAAAVAAGVGVFHRFCGCLGIVVEHCYIGLPRSQVFQQW